MTTHFHRLALAVAALACSASAAMAQPPAKAPGAIAPGSHMAEAAQANPALAAAFKQLMTPLKQASWVASYGTTSPSVIDKTLDTSYLVFHGCKPHDCTSESYAVLVEPGSGKLIAGAFVRSDADGPRLKESRITWLGDAQWDQALLLSKYLF